MKKLTTRTPFKSLLSQMLIGVLGMAFVLSALFVALARIA
jgi:hypothetical protein